MAYEYDDKINFIANLYCPARVVADETGCSWELILAQAAQETGWGEKTLPGTNNIFNIKASSGWTGESKMFHVTEVLNHKTVWVDAPFRVYPSILDSLRDRTEFLKTNARYAKAGLFDEGVKGDYVEEAKALLKAHYATDPNYATALKTLFEGKTMRRAIARAKERGCGPVLPVVELIIMDGARVPIVKAKVQVQQDGKQAEAATDAQGRLMIRITPKSGDIQLKIFDKDKNVWTPLDPVKLDTPAKSKTATLIAPTFTAQTATREHEKTTPPKPAPKPPAAPAGAAAGAGAAASTASAAALKGKYKMYKVAKNDSLASIAAQFKVRYKAIAEANDITSPYIIRPDQMLRIPDVQAALAAQEKKHAAGPDKAHGAAGTGHAPAANDDGGITLASLGKALNEGGNYLHTVFFRNDKANPQTDLMHSSRAPWMVPAQEEFEKGVKRRTGKGQQDPRILEYFKATPTLDKQSASVDETPYCAAFVNWCLGRAGFKGSNSALAASFKKWGRPTKGNKPALGAVAVIQFEGGGYHVTFVAGITKNGHSIATLGGNQGKSHEVSHSRCSVDMVVAYRYPADYPDHDDDYVLHDVASDHAQMTASGTH